MARRYLCWAFSIISLLISTVAVAYMTETSLSSLPVIAVSPQENTGLLSETFTVDITIANVTLENSNGLYAWQFHMNFNPSILNVTSVEEGPFLKTAGDTWWNLFPPIIDNLRGIVLAINTLKTEPKKGALGSGTLASITFQVKAAGETPLHLYNTELGTMVGEEKLSVDHAVVDGFFLLSSIQVDPAITHDPTLRLGKNYTVSIETDDIRDDIWGWEFTLTYNPNVLHGVKVANGNFITKAEHSEAQFIPGTFNNTLGKLSLTTAFFFYLTPPANLTSGPGTLANVTFEVVGVGASNITLGPETRLIGYNATTEEEYNIIDATTMSYRIQHGFFDNTLHDIAVTSVTASPDTVYPGEPVSINATVTNKGDYNETFTVTVYADLDTKVIGDEITVGRQTNINLNAGNSTTLEFNWNTRHARSGIYNVTAMASFVRGEKNRANNVGWQIVVIRGAPVALFDYLPKKPVVNETVTFDASDSYDPDSYPDPKVGIVSYAWNFGDGTTKTYMKDENLTAITTHAYTMVGTYTVSLTVTDNETKTDTTWKTVKVRDYPVAVFTYSPEPPLLNETVTFDASLSDPRGGTILSYEWNFGDGNTTVGDAVITHIYTTFGNHTVTLTITDSEDLSDTFSQTIKILAAPIASFTYSPTEPKVEETITFTSTSNDTDGNILSYEWNFGDGNTTMADALITHIYTTAGNYTVTLTVTDNDNLTNTATTVITTEETKAPSIPLIIIAAAAATIIIIVTIAIYFLRVKKQT